MRNFFITAAEGDMRLHRWDVVLVVIVDVEEGGRSDKVEDDAKVARSGCTGKLD